MKRLIALILVTVFFPLLTGCTNTIIKEEPLSYISGVQNMLLDISTGKMDEAMGRIYVDMAVPELEENLEICAELLDGREIKRCDCYDYERTGDRSDSSTIYTETTYYRIYLTEDYSGEPDFYAKAIGISDGKGDGIISFEIYSEYPSTFP